MFLINQKKLYKDYYTRFCNKISDIDQLYFIIPFTLFFIILICFAIRKKISEFPIINKIEKNVKSL